MKSKTTVVLWIVFIGILFVLLPHTAWLFRQFEPAESWKLIGEFDGADLLSYIAAIAFESAIAVLVHKLAKHWEMMRGKRTRLEKFEYRYLNPFAFGLFISTAISMLANLAHAVEFGTSIKIFTEWGIPSKVYSVAFGGILPIVSLTFARVLSNVTDDEEAPNPELETAKQANAEIRKRLRETEELLRASELRAKDTEEQARALVAAAEDRARVAEGRENAISDLVRRIFGDSKRERIIAVKQQWPQLKGSAIAVIAEAKESYVSEVLSEAIDVTAEYTQKEQVKS